MHSDMKSSLGDEEVLGWESTCLVW